MESTPKVASRMSFGCSVCVIDAVIEQDCAGPSELVIDDKIVLQRRYWDKRSFLRPRGRSLPDTKI
jgi:hypothetical protein